MRGFLKNKQRGRGGGIPDAVIEVCGLICVIRHDCVCVGEKYGEIIIQCSPAMQGVNGPSVRPSALLLSALLCCADGKL